MTFDGGKTLSVHEVYYDDLDRPVMFAPDTASLQGNNVEDLRGTLQLLTAALDREVLTPNKFPVDSDSQLEREYLF